MKLTITAHASADLIAIGDYIARDNRARALSFVEEIEERCRKIALRPLAYPISGRHRDQQIRHANQGRYTIYYVAREDGVVILRVLHQSMDVDDELS